MHRDAAGAGEVHRHPMIGPAIAKEDDVGDAALVQECADESPPVGEVAAIVDRAKPWPEDPVAAGKIDSF